ncbi:two-component system response regulator [Pedobacter aquatilis]|uniref:response regulator n=1 Tax=Pedobacter aquatilis TaxID=351343 RepID=UPI00292FC5F9|nr:response regulator [Pedobacter aquatilis]
MIKRIVAIDDDKDILEIMNIIFQDEGFESILLSNGVDAEEIITKNPDLVLLDVNIVGYHKTGNQICEDIKGFTTANNFPVFLVSAEPDLASIAAHCGADGYISKPFDIFKLTNMIKDFLS